MEITNDVLIAIEYGIVGGVYGVVGGVIAIIICYALNLRHPWNMILGITLGLLTQWLLR